MKKFKSLTFLFLPVLALLFACDGQASSNNSAASTPNSADASASPAAAVSGQVFKGTVTGAAGLQVALDLAHFDRTNTSLGVAACDANGAFEIKPNSPWQDGLYRLKIGPKQLYFMLNGKEGAVQIKGDLNTIDRMEMQVNGSETMTCYQGIIQDLLKNQLKNPEEAKAFIQRACTPLMKAFLTTQLLGQNAGAHLADFKAQNKALAESMPDSKYAKDFANMVSGLESQMTQQQQGGAIKVGMAAPDIKLPDPNGKIRSLSSLKGKVVLLDFWASWCGPCRRENPHVVEIYNKYKSKGFEVFSVSLDRPDGKDRWTDAIKQDGLIWPNHVSDLKFWECAPAQVYGVRSIPSTFLIGKDGKVKAINPRANLEEELLKVL